MAILAALVGLLLIVVSLFDGFDTIVSPRRVNRPVRLTRVFYRATWSPWRAIARRIRKKGRRETMLSYFGPLSLLLLLLVWAVNLIIGFGLLFWALGSPLTTSFGPSTFGVDLYLSGATFTTLGLGDVTPHTAAARALMVAEGGMGLGFLALVLSYLPPLNTEFAEREVNVSLLDERAGSPPTALELLRRNCTEDGMEGVDAFLREWERWSAELMESHLSYPVLAYFRSQHENQSWVAALTMVLDLCALVLVGVDGVPEGPARLTFAMARHVGADLSQVFKTPPRMPELDRLPPADLARLRAELAKAGAALRAGPAADARLAELRRMYEPYVNALAAYLVMELPPWIPPANVHDNWQVTAWEL
ncbi:MAG: potassium channel family protein [Chloroflexi bacterium]|nr:potassium channel family protein [Chloroflexota bacterium]MCL5952704.1 potassium channel family protein [Chloroflexota bacterium]